MWCTLEIVINTTNPTSRPKLTWVHISVRSNSSDWDNLKIYDAYWVAFKHDTGFLIGGEDNDGGGRVVHSWNDGHSQSEWRAHFGVI